jgi:hypothetical protein
MNDREQLFMLQKAFLFPHKIGGKCLIIDVTVKGRIDMVTNNYIYDDYPEYCRDRSGYLIENSSCIIYITKYFELLPAPAIPVTIRTLVEFLRSYSIVQVLAALDPSFHTLINEISNDLLDYTDDDYDYAYDLPPDPNSYDIKMSTVGNIDLSDPTRIEADVTDALYATLSWVSYIIVSFISIITASIAGKGLY